MKRFKLVDDNTLKEEDLNEDKLWMVYTALGEQLFVDGEPRWDDATLTFEKDGKTVVMFERANVVFTMHESMENKVLRMVAVPYERAEDKNILQ